VPVREARCFVRRSRGPARISSGARPGMTWVLARGAICERLDADRYTVYGGIIRCYSLFPSSRCGGAIAFEPVGIGLSARSARRRIVRALIKSLIPGNWGGRERKGNGPSTVPHAPAAAPRACPGGWAWR
jgi:hypothetical protein